MIIGVPKEIKEQEFRVALLPSAAYLLAKRGHQVLVERGAGTGAGYPDAEYEKPEPLSSTIMRRCSARRI
jgi:alanine dehydrogenase